MTSLKVIAVGFLVFGLSLAASATSVDYANANGTLTWMNGGTAVSLTKSKLIGVIGGVCPSTCTGGNLGSVVFTSGTLNAGGSLATGGTFAAGGTLTVTGNGKNGVPSGVLFQGTFTSATWTVNSLGNGKTAFSFQGAVQGTGAFAGIAAFTVQGSKIVHGNPFATGGSGSVKWASGDTTAGGVPEPGTLSLLGTGVLGIAGLVRRKLKI